LAKEPNDRYASMGELGSELAALVNEESLLTSGGGHTSVRPSASDQPSSSLLVAAPTVQKTRSAAPLVIGSALVVLAAAVLLLRTHKTVVQSPPPSRIPTTITVPDPPMQPVPKPAPIMEEVIVDSVPPGAKIYVDDVRVADTPEAIKVEKGTKKTIVLKKDGYLELRETLDPERSHKVLVHLARPRTARATKPVKPAAPTIAPAPATTVAPVKRAPKRESDPYERIDAPSKTGDVLNPY
jgi:hypothetical protein